MDGGRKQPQLLDALHAASRSLSGPVELGPEAIYTTLVRALRGARDVLGAKSGTIILVEDAAWGDLVPPDLSGNRTGAHPEGLITLQADGKLRRRRHRDGGVVMHVVGCAEHVFIEDARAPHPLGPFPGRVNAGTLSFGAVPLMSGGRSLGVLTVGFDTPHTFVHEEVRALELFSVHLAATLERLRHLSETRRRAGMADDLAQTLADVGAADSLEEALRALLVGAIRLLHGDEGMARVYGAGQDGKALAVRVRADGSPAPVISPEPQEGTISGALHAGQPGQLVMDFWAFDPKTYPAYEEMRSVGMRSSVAVPILSSSGRLGSLHVTHHAPGYFTQEDLTLAGALASLAGSAIERARLQAERERTAQDRARLDGALLVARTVAHDINNALSPITGFADLLAMRPSVAADAQAAQYAARVAEAAESVADKVHRLQQIIRLEETASPLGPDRPILDLDRSTS
jgi:GAF domain-containing protein